MLYFDFLLNSNCNLFGKYNSVNNHIVCYLDPDHVQKGRKHELVFTATDDCGNEVTEIYNFTW